MSTHISVVTYQGTWVELAEFVQRVWFHYYGHRMLYPGWTAEYFEWQLGEESNRDNLLAVYDEDQLVGVLPGANRRMRTSAGSIQATQWSWLSVDPAYRGKGIVKALDEERHRRLNARESELTISYRYVGSKLSRAERPNSRTPNKHFHARLGLWVRILRPDRFAQWHFRKWEGRLACWLEPLYPRIGQRSGTVIRDAIPEDLEACVELLNTSTSSFALSIDWDRDSLHRQFFGSALSKTLVMEHDGNVVALFNYHVIPFHACNTEQVAVIDLMAGKPDAGSSLVDLIRATLGRMKDDGVMIALKIRSGDVPIWPLARNAFVLQAADSYLVLNWLHEPVKIPRRARLNLLWR